ncbi:MAG: chemotaxis protein CheW [Bryocella sp.]
MSDSKQPNSTPRLAPWLETRQAFFARPVPDGYADEWAAVLAQPLAEEVETKASMLEVRLGEMQLAIASRYVKAVTEALIICPVPHRSNTAFLGLVAFGGEVIPCVSLVRILGAADAITGTDARTIVLEDRPGERWAFMVHAVLGVSTGAIRARSEEQVSGLGHDWSECVFDDEHGRLIEILKSETLFQRLKRATA